MKQAVVFIALLALALADKPDPIYKSPAAKTKTVVEDLKTASSDKIQSRQDEYGAPAAPAADSYGSPAAPVEDSYGSPQAAPVQESYGAPKAEPQAAPAQGSVGTQGYYYYYYPVASSNAPSPGYNAPSKNGASSGGLLSGGLLIPIVLGLGLLLLLAVGAAALFNNGRSFPDGQSILASMAPFADELTVSVMDAIKVYADLNEVSSER